MVGLNIFTHIIQHEIIVMPSYIHRHWKHVGRTHLDTACLRSQLLFKRWGKVLQQKNDSRLRMRSGYLESRQFGTRLNAVQATAAKKLSVSRWDRLQNGLAATNRFSNGCQTRPSRLTDLIAASTESGNCSICEWLHLSPCVTIKPIPNPSK
jgi:hypothetical protein